MKELIKTASLAHNLFVSRRNPVSLVHFVTNRCNARCSFCFIDFDDPKTFSGELSIDEIDKLTKGLGPNLQNVNLTGGEPFARKDFLDIVRCYLRNTDVKSIFITSNGSLPKRVKKLLDVVSQEFPDKKILLQFSIDAWPDEHDRIRKIDGLFESCMESYLLTKKYNQNIQGNIAITISHENYEIANELYDYLVSEKDVEAVTVGIVRDEGVYKIPIDHKKAILNAYTNLTNRITNDLKSGVLKGWSSATVQGRMMNKKNQLMYSIMDDIYLEPRYVTPCRAGSIFGVIEADGRVRPCEILEKYMGNLRDYDMDLIRLWRDLASDDLRRWIADSKCNCHYDCAWSFNILANREYRIPLAMAAIGLK